MAHCVLECEVFIRQRAAERVGTIVVAALSITNVKIAIFTSFLSLRLRLRIFLARSS
jgi:hypothetical protein